MGYDPFSPIAPALINVLCIPASRYIPEKFDKHLSWLRKFASIIKIPSDGGEGNSELVKQESALLFDFDSNTECQERLKGLFFEPNRAPCLVLGFFDSSSSDPNEKALAESIRDAKSRLAEVLGATPYSRSPSQILVFDSYLNVDIENVMFVSAGAEHVNGSLSAWMRQAVLKNVAGGLSDLLTAEVDLPQSSQASNRLSGVEARVEENKRQSIMPSLTRTPTQTPPIPEDGAQIANSGKTISTALLKLQIGAWSDALSQFAEGARAARDANSPAWHAKALEGILVCLLLLAWSGTSFQIPQNCYPTSRGLSSSSAVHNIAESNRAVSEKFTGSSTNHLQALTAMLPGLLATVMNLYDRSILGFDNALPSIYACEAKIRMARLLIKLQRNGSILNNHALQDIVGHQEFVYNSQTFEPAVVSLILRTSALSNLLIEAVTDAQIRQSIQAITPIYLAVCNSLSVLKLERKQGLYLKDILQKLPPVLMEARRAGIAETNGNPFILSKALQTTNSDQHKQSAKSIRTLLWRLARMYDLPDFYATGAYDGHSEDHIQRRLSTWLAVFKGGDIATKLEVLRCCVRVSDALPDFVGSIQFMSLLLFIVRQTITLSRGIGSPVPLIATEEQVRLAAGINNAIQVANTANTTQVYAEYWDDFLVRDIRLHDHLETGKLVPHTSQDLSHTTTSGTAKKDPFIYNPFSEGRASSGPAILVKNEVASFDVLLQNPLEIDIEIESIALYTEGCSFESNQHNALIGPLCLQTFTLKGIPLEIGSVKIVGCHVKIKNCAARDFLTFNGMWKPLQISKRQLATSMQVELPTRSILELKVIDPLPNLVISSTSLIQNSIMLLDGETATFSVELQNLDDIPADLVLFSFQDSVSRQLRDALETKDLMPIDAHEFQYQLATRPVIKRISNGKKEFSHTISPANVSPNSSRVFEFKVLGKPGLTEAIILTDYAYLGKPRNEIDGTFYTRQLRLTVSLTVNASIDIPRCNVLALPSGSIGTSSSIQKSTPGKPSQADICLLQLDLRSIWQSPVAFTIETSLPSEAADDQTEATSTREIWSIATKSTLQPTQIERALIPIPRLYIQDPFEPIPTLDTSATKRQFVVSASKLSLEAETAAREAFWYREKLCRLLRITWKEEYGTRHGEIDVRKGIRLSARMIDALRVEHVQIDFSLKPSRPEDRDVVTQKGSSHFEVKRTKLATLVVKVHNLTQEDLKLLLRLQPSLHDQPHNAAMDLSKKFVWSGVLQRILGEPLKPGQTVEAELGIVVLARSVYEVNATVEEVRSRRRELDGASGIGPNMERRIWHARNPCLITAVD